ncbi:MAG: hypothetical protein AAFZ87_08310 [Planctomycetota bacterium]
MTPWPLVAHAAVTWALVGLIWTIHVVHYPMFAHVGDAFERVHERHMRAITPVVGPLMLAELATAAWLWAAPPAGTTRTTWAIGLGLVGVVWALTGLFAKPDDSSFECAGFDASAHRLLMRADLLRTLVWTARGVLVAWVLVRLLGGGAAGVDGA